MKRLSRHVYQASKFKVKHLEGGTDWKLLDYLNNNSMNLSYYCNSICLDDVSLLFNY